MKKKIKLNKKKIAELDKQTASQVKGGGTTSGCTDGCSILATWWNCTSATCTADCSSNPSCTTYGL